MQGVEAWLSSIGLGEYAQRFVENGVDLSTLPDLTEDDLKELGVLLGHRRKLFRAIRTLGTDAADAPPTPHRSIDSTVERRQLTVMFCDLVGSTALSARLDPEDMRIIISCYHKAAAKAVQDYDGFVAKYMGDGILAYFGYPKAHEHDAEHAVQAELAITEVAPTLENAFGETLHVRVGIATGIVVVGDIIGSGESSERGVVGDTPNLAARLQGIAKPDSVVIAEATRRLIGDLFQLSDLGTQELKGIASEPRAFEVVRARSAESRFEAMGGALTPLVGRDEETELLLYLWGKAKDGEGQVVLLSGEAGIGKSRLAADLMDRIAEEPHVRLRYFCSPQRVDSAFFPIINHLERAARLFREDSPSAKLDKLDGLLAQSNTSPDDKGLLADMLGLANDGRYTSTQLAPQERRRNTLVALVRRIETLSRKTPTLMVFEDAHWADPSSLEALGQLIQKIAGLNVLLIVTHRFEFASPWNGQQHVTALTLNRLGRREIDFIVGQIAGNKVLSVAVRADIAERADGVPLFAEEIAKAVAEARDHGEAIGSIPSTVGAVPASLHASLMARLDRLGPAKEVVQIGSVIGREFSYGLLARVVGEPQRNLQMALDDLVTAGLFFRHDLQPDEAYSFKHVLLRDAAYSTMLRSRRKELHRRIVCVLRRDFPDLIPTQPELLARHCTEAGMILDAVEYYFLASRRATAASNILEAGAHLKRARALVDQLPSSEPRKGQLLQQIVTSGWWFS